MRDNVPAPTPSTLVTTHASTYSCVPYNFAKVSRLTPSQSPGAKTMPAIPGLTSSNNIHGEVARRSCRFTIETWRMTSAPNN